ncbi:unnamed protein product, partial [Didymodactylos carnosus]
MISNRSLRHHYVYIPESSSKFYTRPPEPPTYLHGNARRNYGAATNRAVNNEYKRRKFPPLEIPKLNYDIVFVHRETPIRRLDELIK